MHFITDENHIREAAAFEEAAQSAGAVAKISVLPSNEIQEGQVFEELQNVMSYADAVIGATHYSFVTTSAVDFALKKGARFLSMPLHTNDGSSIFENDFITMDPHAAMKSAGPLVRVLRHASQIHVTTKAGTDITFSKEGRKAGVFCGLCAKKRAFASSSFEVYVPIEETKTNGVLVVDGSLGYLGTKKQPVRLEFRDGYLVKIEDNDTGKALKEYMEHFNDREMFCAAEFGIGLNAKSRCRGVSYIEDESALGTFHVGMGRNLALGGAHDAAGHFDLVMQKPDIYAEDKQIMDAGRICQKNPISFINWLITSAR